MSECRALKVRIYPTEEQISIINKTFGCCRFIYNNYLCERTAFYDEIVKPVKKDLSKDELKELQTKNMEKNMIG